MTSEVVRQVRDAIARLRHVSPAGARQECRALVDQLPPADRAALRLWAVELVRVLGPASPARSVLGVCPVCGARVGLALTAPVGVVAAATPTLRRRILSHGIGGDAGAATCSGSGRFVLPEEES